MTAALDPRTRRQMRKVWFSVFLNSTAMMAVLPHVPRYLEERFHLEGDRWATISGLVFGAAPLAAAAAGPLWGALGDRFSRKFNLARAQLAILAFFLLFPLAGRIWLLVLLRFLQGLFAGYVAPAFSLATAGWPAERRGSLLGRLQVAMTLGLLLGPVLGAEALATFGRAAPFRLAALLVALALALTLSVREDRSTLKDGSGGAPKGRLLDGFRLLFGSRVLLLFLGAMVLGRLGASLVEPLLAVFVREELGPLALLVPGNGEGATDRTIALLSTILGLGVLLFGPIWGRLGDRFRPVRTLAVAGSIMGISLAAMTFAGDSLGLLACRALFALGFAGMLPLSYAAISRITPRASVAAAYALNQSAIQVALGLGFASGGLLRGGLGMRPLFVLAAALALLGFGSLPLARRARRREERGGIDLDGPKA